MTNYANAPSTAAKHLQAAQAATVQRRPGNRRLVAWLVLVAAIAAISFAGNALAPPTNPASPQNVIVDGSSQPSSGSYYPAGAPPSPTSVLRDDTFYRYSTGVGGLIQYGILLGLVLLIARGLPSQETFALYRPRSWPRTVGLVVGMLATTYVLLAVVSTAIGRGADPDQGIPVFWDGTRAAQFVLSFIVVVVAAPVVEELMFRGLGFTLLSKFGFRSALFATAVLFGLMHGFVLALPLFVIVGLVLGWLRMRTGSVYPAMLTHGLFNAAATITAVTLGA